MHFHCHDVQRFCKTRDSGIADPDDAKALLDESFLELVCGVSMESRSPLKHQCVSPPQNVFSQEAHNRERPICFDGQVFFYLEL